MIAAEFDYAVADSVDDAIAKLADGGADAKLLAGGHSLLPLMKLRFAAPSLLVDLRKVDELRGIQTGDDSFVIGALTRHSELQAREDMGLISAVASKIADQQVRNRGTIGGSLSHGDSAADFPAMLLAYDGTVTVRGSGGDREISAADLFEGYMTTAVGAGEVLTHVRIPALVGYGYAHEKFSRRAEDWAMVGVCALVKSSDGVCEDVRIGLTAMAVDAAAGDRGGGRPARAAAGRRAHRGGGGSWPPTARARSATSTPRRSTSSTSRGC